MADSVRVKRGLKANLPTSLPLGELAFCTDTGELFVGTESSIKKVIDPKLVQQQKELSSQLETIENEAILKTKDKTTYVNVNSGVSSDLINGINYFEDKYIKNDSTGVINVTGKYTFTETLVINIDNGDKVKLIGETPINKNIVSVSSFLGAVPNCTVEISLSDVVGITVGDYVLINDLTGTYQHVHYGAWEITKITGNTITILNTTKVKPGAECSVTGGSLSIIKTVLTFNGCSGVSISAGKSIGFIDNMIIRGNKLGDYGFLCGGYNGTSKEARANATAYLGHNFAVCNFKRSGIWSGYGSYIYCSGRTMACSNGEAGFEGDTGGNFATGWDDTSKTVSNGNGIGFNMFNGSNIWCGVNTVACGNGRGFMADCGGGIRIGANSIANYNDVGGVYASMSSSIFAYDGLSASYNKGFGFFSDKCSSLSVNNSFSRYNTSHGYMADINGMINAKGSVSEYNGMFGYRANNSSTIIADNTTSAYNNQGYIAEKGSILIAPNSKSEFNTNTSSNKDYLAGTMSYIEVINCLGTPTFNTPVNVISSEGALIKK